MKSPRETERAVIKAKISLPARNKKTISEEVGLSKCRFRPSAFSDKKYKNVKSKLGSVTTRCSNQQTANSSYLSQGNH